MVSHRRSLSARRAWIEIQNNGPSFSVREVVALRKESVDRNKELIDKRCQFNRSLSARRAWIEMAILARASSMRPVALRKESVDRNPLSLPNSQRLLSRSPQGERG